MKYYEYNKEFDRECALGYFANPGLSRQLVAVSCLVTNLNYKPTMKLRIRTTCGFSAITLITMLIYASSYDATILDILHVQRIAKMKQENAANSALIPNNCIGSNAASLGKTTFTEFLVIKSL